MSYIDQITKENFISKFNIQEILNQSVYYPASGIDASDIECLGNKFNIFIDKMKKSYYNFTNLVGDSFIALIKG